MASVPAEALDVGEDHAEEGEHERHRELRRDGVDAPDRNVVPRLPREGQGDEPDHVECPDEDEERGHVREPAADRLGGKPLLCDLGLGDLVDSFPDRLPLARQLLQLVYLARRFW